MSEIGVKKDQARFLENTAPGKGGVKRGIWITLSMKF